MYRFLRELRRAVHHDCSLKVQIANTKAAEQTRTKDQQIQQLQRETEELREELEEWQQKYEDAEYLADISADVTGARFQDLLEEMSGAAASDAQAPFETATIEFDGEAFEVPEVIEAEVLEIREEKRAIEADLSDVREERDCLQERVDELEAQVAEQSQVDALRRLRDDVRELVKRNEDLVRSDDHGGMGAESSRMTETPTSDTVSVTESSDASFTSLEEATRRELVEHAAIQRAIEATAADAEFSDKWFYRAMDILAASDGSLSAQEAATMTNVSDSTMRPVLQDLSKTGIVQSIGERPERFTLDREVLERRIYLEGPHVDRSSHGS